MKEPAIISETVEHQIKVLQILEKLGYKWRTQHKPTEIVPLKINSKQHVIYLDVKSKRLSVSDLDFLKTYQTTEITYDELLRQNKKVIL